MNSMDRSTRCPPAEISHPLTDRLFPGALAGIALAVITGVVFSPSWALADEALGPPDVIADPRPEQMTTTTGEYIPDPMIDLLLTARKNCEGSSQVPPFTHQVRVQWQMPDVETGVKRVTVRALLSDGEVVEKQDAGHTGSIPLLLNRPLGSQIIVSAVAETEHGNAVDNNTLVLNPCDEVPRPDPGVGFDAPIGNPGMPGGAPGPITESHFTHLGGTGNPNSVLMVSAVGTGAIVKLSSWTLVREGSEIFAPLVPTLLETLDEDLIGYNAKLHTLSPELSPKFQAAPFVNGIIRNGQLWITSRQLNNGGEFTALDTRGYGGAVSRTETVRVREYAMAHRSITVGGTAYFELITPILTENDKLRVLSWAIRKSDGTIFGLQDSGNLIAKPHGDSLVSISRIRNGEGVDYVMQYRTDRDVMASVLLEVLSSTSLNTAGIVRDRGNAASGLNLSGTSTAVELINQAVVLPLNRQGYVTRKTGYSRTLISVWDYLYPGFDGIGVPYKIADQTLDKDFGLGVDVGLAPTLTDGSHPQIQGGATQKVRARLTDDLWEETFGVGGGEIASVFPAGEISLVGIASVTKVMTLLLAVEAVNNGDAALGDIVEVSSNAANTGGSTMNLVTGEKHSLANLMYGMMMVSANDASVAIAEHIAAKTVEDGTMADFVDQMNSRAVDLNLLDTFYNHPAAGGYSSPQDQITLFRFGSMDPIFREFSERRFYTACGETTNGFPLCRNVDKFADGYPGVEGWKGGNLGIPAAELPGVPLCTSCLIAQARRVNRSMLVGLQQSGARWSDAGKLWDYGFTRFFTPDRRASSIDLGTVVKDVAVDTVNENLAVTAVIDSVDDFRLCLWRINAESGVLFNNPVECATLPGFNLPGNPAVTVIPNDVAGARISNSAGVNDYITVEGGLTSYSILLWRVGSSNP